MLRFAGSGVSPNWVKLVLELLGGWFEERAAVLLYPSSVSANEEARYHWMTCSGRGQVLVSLSKEGVKATMLLVLLATEQFATTAAKTAETEELSPTRR